MHLLDLSRLLYRNNTQVLFQNYLNDKELKKAGSMERVLCLLANSVSLKMPSWWASSSSGKVFSQSKEAPTERWQLSCSSFSLC